MSLTGKYFSFNGISSEDFNLVLGGDTWTEGFELGIDRSVISGDLNRFRSQVNSIGSKYDDVLSFSFTVIKDPCSYTDPEAALFTRDEIRAINKWLTSPSMPKLLYFNSDDEENVFYFATIVSSSNETFNGNIYQLTFSVTCDSPFAYTDLQETIYETDGSAWMTKTVKVDSDDPESFIYPIIVIEPKATQESVSIKNTTDNASSVLTIKNVKNKDTITINCQLQQIYDEAGVLSLEDIGLTDESELYIPRLLDGNNRFACKGNAVFTVKYRCPRKVGNTQ